MEEPGFQDYAALRSLDDGKVVRGRDGWLFLDNDANDVFRQHSGELRLSDEQLEGWRAVLEERISWLEERGSAYFFLVPPNPHSVYPEKLPPGTRTAAERPIHQLIRHLSEHSFASAIYPLEALLAEKEQRPVYPSNSSHWNAAGGFVAYTVLMREMSSAVEARVLSWGDVVFWNHEWVSDLGAKLSPNEVATQTGAGIRKGRPTIVSDNEIWGNGRLRVYECHDAPDATCLLLGDSFSYPFMVFLAASFRRLVFAHIPTLDRELVAEASPDVVVSLLNERFLVEVPTDAAAPSLRAWEQQKRERGETVAAMQALRAEPEAR